jgi:hypothetical protein
MSTQTNQRNRHPFARGHFESGEAEIKAVQGQMSAAQMARAAARFERHAAARLPFLKRLRSAERLKPEILEFYELQYADAIASAAEWRKWQAEAVLFEARWAGFDIYDAN